MNARKRPIFEVRLRSRRVRRELDATHEPDRRRILAALRALERVPRPPGCEKLYGSIYRVRVGSWRIVYLIDEKQNRIEVGGIRRRSERTYKGIEDLFA